MPTRRILTGDRHNPLTTALWKRFKAERKIEIDWETFKNIIWTSNQLLSDSIANEESGIELPERLGHIVVSKYRSSIRPVDWIQTRRLGKRIPLLNLHSYGYIFYIRWFKAGCSFKNRRIYKFQPYRLLKRAIAANAKKGKQYFKWDDSDFWSATKLERSFSKFYKKEDGINNS